MLRTKAEALAFLDSHLSFNVNYFDLVDFDVAMKNIAKVYNHIQTKEDINECIDMRCIHCGTQHCLAGWHDIVIRGIKSRQPGSIRGYYPDTLNRAAEGMWPIADLFYRTRLKGESVMKLVEQVLIEGGYDIKIRTTTITEPEELLPSN